jgi:REP element-mobilizing transposase RayT
VSKRHPAILKLGELRATLGLAHDLLQRLDAMAYPVRHFDPQTIYFITSRTLQSRFLLAPSAKANELIGGILARAVRQCEVELFAYVFTSNHFHAMVRAPSAVAMSKFMQQLQSNIAIKVGRLVDWRGRFFARRYSAEPIVDEEAQVERLIYIMSHGVKEGLVSEVKKWPGLSSVRALLDGGSSTMQKWRNWTRRWKMETEESTQVGRFAEECPSELETLKLTPLPAWRGLSAQIDADAPNKNGMSAAQIVAQDPHHRPQQTKHSPRPKAHASTEPLWVAAVDRYRVILAAFRVASRQWLEGHFDALFPAHCFRPPVWSLVSRIV